MRVIRKITALGSITSFLLSASPVLASGATPSATGSSGSGLPQAGIEGPTLILLALAVILVFFGTVGLISKSTK